MLPPYVTFSRNVFIPLTNICRNRCGYCGFRRDIWHPEAALLTPSQVAEILLKGAKAGCTEALFTFGERPEEVEGFNSRLSGIGYDSVIDYLADMCRLSADIGLLPHSNPGVIEKSDMKKLRPVNSSMGLMLETIAKVEAHEGCRGKNPQARMAAIEQAGDLKIPFTTGILVGIGEKFEDRVKSILAIRRIHQQFGHIQEVIIQNFTPKPGSRMSSWHAPLKKEMVEIVSVARHILPSDVAIQVAPNLIDPVELIRSGASDLGGISPETIDHINPESPWPDLKELQASMDALHIPLRERLPIYPAYIKKKWYSKEIAHLVESLSDADGFRKPY